MNHPDTRRVRRPATDDEKERFGAYQKQVAQDLPELREEARRVESQMRSSAMGEQTLSGQLRRAIAASGLDHRELAAQTGLSPRTLAEFLAGAAPLDSSAFDRLATFLKHELKPTIG